MPSLSSHEVVSTVRKGEHLGTWLMGNGGGRRTVGLDNPGCLFQPY